MREFTDAAKVGDVFTHLEPSVNFETAEIENGGGDDLVVPVGYPLKDGGSGGGYALAHTGDDASVIALVCEDGVYIPAGETRKVCVLVRGPAAINVDQLPVDDIDGSGAIVPATYAAAMQAVDASIAVRSEPSTKQTQTD